MSCILKKQNFVPVKDFIKFHFLQDPSKSRFIAVMSTFRLLYHGTNPESSNNDHSDCLQADATHKTNLHGFPTLIVGTFKNLYIFYYTLIYFLVDLFDFIYLFLISFSFIKFSLISFCFIISHFALFYFTSFYTVLFYSIIFCFML